MSKLTSLALAAVAAGTIFAAGAIATASPAEARHGYFGGGLRVGIGFGYRGLYRPFYRPIVYGGIYRSVAYRPWIYRPRLVVLPPSPCRIVLRPNYFGRLVPVRLCRAVY